MKVKPGAMVAMEGTVQIRGEVKVSLKKIFTGGEMAESIFSGFGEGTAAVFVAVSSYTHLLDPATSHSSYRTRDLGRCSPHHHRPTDNLANWQGCLPCLYPRGYENE